MGRVYENSVCNPLLRSQSGPEPIRNFTNQGILNRDNNTNEPRAHSRPKSSHRYEIHIVQYNIYYTIIQFIHMGPRAHWAHLAQGSLDS
ncbi:hypothetical protein EPI10_001879 [Gossypium australe]|uniref:Uncharacterized protein n=1 Tax=Gossypium australe TaxID=47621 RepID=A0A5B6VCJ6_9ROSI|nr:hypothetical protein EPI10_001879 [Gossypium australe]